MSTVLEYGAPPVDRREILRYAGVRGAAPELETLLDDCLSELLGSLTYRVCYRLLFRTELEPLLGASALSERFLQGFDRVLLFGATIGLAPDRLMLKYGSTSPTRALLIQAIGAERIGALCDLFCGEMRDTFGMVGQRFSPGYGDLPLERQRLLFDLLGNTGQIGLTLNDSLLMSPTKSVTALLGVGDPPKLDL